MGSSGLRFEQVVEAGLQAWCAGESSSPAPDDPHPVHFDYVFEDGDVWLKTLDLAGRIVSMRAVRPSEVPPDGWRHSTGCDCPHCSS